MIRFWIFTVFIIGLWNGVSEASSCTARGRFPNENAPYCRGYTMCLSGAPGIYMEYNLSCPENFVYSHIDNQCTNVTSYQCHPQYNCTITGNFEADADKNCTMYIACIHGLNQIVTARLIQCPEDTLYSPLEDACVNNTMFSCVSNEPSIVLDPVPSQEADDSDKNNAINLCSNKYMFLVYLIFGNVWYVEHCLF